VQRAGLFKFPRFLRSANKVIDMFGGGTYQFIAFDTRGNFSRWTPEKEKVRVDLPSKPFRQVERPAEPAPASEHQPPRMAPSAPDYMSVWMQQSIAAQERADRLLTALIERLATQPPAPAPAPPPPPPPDPIAMMSGLAAILEKLRPAQAGDMVNQLSGLVSVVNKLKGSQPSESSPEDVALQPFLTMVTNAMLQNSGGSKPPASPPPPQHPSPGHGPELVWVLVPEIGPVMMRPDQATRMLARSAGAGAPAPAGASPAAPAAAAGASPASPAPQSPQAAHAPPTNAAPAAASPSAAPTLPSSAQAPAPAPPAPPILPAIKPAAARSSERCIVCGEPGRRDPVQGDVLICRHNHRSLVVGAEVPRAPAASPVTSQGDEPSVTISASDLDAMLADPDVLQALSPEITAALKQVRAQLGEP